MSNNLLQPIVTEPRLAEPIWGGASLAAWLNLPEPWPERLGESWQVFDTNRIVNGPYAGKSLSDLVSAYGAEMVGTRAIESYGIDFPLLAKFIEAADHLSIQVHPDDAYAHRVEAGSGFHGKTEAWYIVDAVPGASITYGLNRTCDRETFAAAIADGSVERFMSYMPVAPGDVIFVPAGTLHAIHAGILLFEIQQKSNLTYRVYDYDRRDVRTGLPRELHLERALEISELAPATSGKVVPLRLGPNRDLLIACHAFALERWRGLVEMSTEPGSFEIWTVVAGKTTLSWAAGSLVLQRGASVVLPAGLGAYSMRPNAYDTTLLRAYLPDLDRISAEAFRVSGDPVRVNEVVRYIQPGLRV